MPITLDKISKSYSGKTVIDNLSAVIPDTGITLITGASGAGKTTLLKIIAGLERADSGEIRGTGDRKLSMVFQEDRLLGGSFTALENVTLVCDTVPAEKWLDAMELGNVKNKKTAELSGGMRRRVALARALAYGGDILLLDEPFKGLDAQLRERILPHIAEFSRNASVILVTHDRVNLTADCIIELK